MGNASLRFGCAPAPNICLSRFTMRCRAGFLLMSCWIVSHGQDAHATECFRQGKYHSCHSDIETDGIDGRLSDPSLPMCGRGTSPRCPTFYTCCACFVSRIGAGDFPAGCPAIPAASGFVALPVRNLARVRLRHGIAFGINIRHVRQF